MNITPVQILNKTATQLNIQVVYVRLGNQADITWQLLDASGAQLLTGVAVIGGAAYAAWGIDDSYIPAQVAAQLGVTLA